MVLEARAVSWRHPRWLLAAKSAFAAGLALLVVTPFGGVVDDYAYYAPLGALVAMSTAVASSVRSAAQAVLAIVLGAALALGASTLPVPAALALAAAIAVGTLLAGWRALGSMGSWVPFAALFVLIVGGEHPLRYAAAYGGLTALGAAIGIGVALALPQMPLTPAVIAQEQLREGLADQLERLADGLSSERVLTQEDWEQLRVALSEKAAEVEELFGGVAESRRGNWQAKRWAETADRRHEQARALQRLSGSVDEVIELVADVRTVVHADDPAAAELRTATAAAFRAVAAMLRGAGDSHGDGADEEAPTVAARQAEVAVETLRDHSLRAAAGSGALFFPAAAITVTLERAVDAWS